MDLVVSRMMYLVCVWASIVMVLGSISLLVGILAKAS